MNLVLPDDSIEAERSKLWVISCVSNPAQWRTRYTLATKFRRHITEDLKANLITVECAMGTGGFHVVDSAKFAGPDESVASYTLENGVKMIDVRVRNKSWTWLKENLQNIAVSKLPTSAKYLVFCDMDIVFANRNVAEHIIYALGSTFKIVQPFETCCDLGNEGQVIQVHRSFGACVSKGMVWRPKLKKDSKGATYGVYHEDSPPPECNNGINNWHPGFCMAMTRETFGKLSGLLQTACAGAGDHHMITACIGRAEESFPKTVHPNYRAMVLDWQARAKEAVKGSLGYVQGTILHQFHGPKKNRRYISRWSIITDNQYDPKRDIYFNTDGVMEINAVQNPKLHADIRRYFISRNEDDVNNE